jgi:endonuclease/exonuclease/phosphatase family metal-dependent hydrolase
MKIVTWNAERMFSTGGGTIRASPADAVATLKILDADIVAIPEFAMRSSLSAKTITAIKKLGYTMVTVDYHEKRAVSLQYAVLIRGVVSEHHTHRLANSERFVVELKVIIASTRVTVFATHLDDRSEQARQYEVEQLCRLIKSSRGPVILLGDMNAMDGGTWRARLLRTRLLRLLSRLSPSKDGYSIGGRLIEMASGKTIEAILTGTKLVSATSPDPTISAKQVGLEWAPSTALVKIDWIFISPDLIAESSQVYPDVGSDHRPLAVYLK